MRRANAPKWARPSEYGHTTCALCGKVIYNSEEFEAVKPKGGRPTAFYHTACIEKEKERTGR